MKKTFLRTMFLLSLMSGVQFANADSCTVKFLLSDYGTIYDLIRYTFIPFSSVDPLRNGGGQFFVKFNGIWLASAPVPWKSAASVLVSKELSCDVLYKDGMRDAVVSYADLTKGAKNAPASAQNYCLVPGSIGAGQGSQTITAPQFGPNNGYWKIC